MAHDKPCGVVGCPALAVDVTGLCAPHSIAKRAGATMADTRCQACQRLIAVDEYVTRDSTLVEMRHAVCPPTRPYHGHKRNRTWPLFEDVHDETR
jgi:hypothetical protein